MIDAVYYISCRKSPPKRLEQTGSTIDFELLKLYMSCRQN